MSTLIHETPLTFSAQLAATIGLEEAILLPLLHDYFQLQGQPSSRIAVAQLSQRLPFWQLADIQRVLKSLSDKGIIFLLSAPVTQTDTLEFQFETPAATRAQNPANIASIQAGANRISPHWKPDATVLEQLAQQGIPADFAGRLVGEFVTYWRDSGQICHSWNARFLKHAVREWQRHRADAQHFLPASDLPVEMQQSWRPSPDAVEILQRNGIAAGFIDDAIPEFVLYWRERGAATTTWNSKFIQHVKRQWARFTQTLKYDTEPRPIPANWQPEAEVFDILQMANIDEQFARQCISEFVLYWKDSNQLHSSWNTKFLQHVKYCWANKHQLPRVDHAGQRLASGQDPAAAGSFISKHTDRSWREGL